MQHFNADYKKEIPWWLKIGAKIVLSRLPIPYSFWKRVGLFELGDMNQPKRALDIFLEHARTGDVVSKGDRFLQFKMQGDNIYTVLELGPGDSLFTALIAKSLGASQTWLVDAGSFATKDSRAYANMIDCLFQQGFSVPYAASSMTVGELLKACAAEYLIDGVRSLAQLSPNSVDYCFSNVVLEHIPKADLVSLAEEFFRVMKPDGVCVHRVDLRDHLGGRLNNLRFANATWEGALFRKSGFYTNRIRFGEMIALFEKAGFNCQLDHVVRWDELPTPRAKLDKAFRYLPDDDLLVSGFDLILRRKH
jgi:SAM-dependent methyltransferase